jgi:ABC-2 type transport system permease protein
MLDMNKIKTIVRKEWAEVFKNRMVLFTVAFMPLLFTALPLIILYATRDSVGSTNLTSDLPSQLVSMCPPGLNGGECFQVYIISEFMLMFMILPLAIPVTISAYSIVGEKSTRSLEPLLATPITTIELLIGKCIAAAVPAILATYIAFAVYAIGAWILLWPNHLLFSALLDLRWLIAIIVVGPLMALFAITVSIMVSSRVNDPRVAEQLSMVVILPLLLVFFGQIGGVILISRKFVLYSVFVLILLDGLLLYLSARLFQRETILTRWK